MDNHVLPLHSPYRYIHTYYTYTHYLVLSYVSRDYMSIVLLGLSKFLDCRLKSFGLMENVLVEIVPHGEGSKCHIIYKCGSQVCKVPWSFGVRMLVNMIGH